ncbi:ribosomal RNA small subunit methyltransferase A, partial [bacterium]|nr:ribosomal RNA small subunit methyltransferase A [bacterium]
MTRNEIRNILKKIGVTPSKRLGQSFLASDSYNRAIIDALGVESEDVILEIGSGFGNLTSLLLEAEKTVIAVEIDKRLCDYLQEKFGKFERFHLICKDILDLDLIGIKDSIHPNGQKLEVIGNIPYSISSPIIKHMILHRDSVKDIHLLIQREVWERLSAEPGNKEYGFFTILVNLHYSVIRIFDISRENFYPNPKVDSTFVRFVPIERNELKNREFLLKLLSKVFSQRR